MVSIALKINVLEERYNEAASNVFKEHGIFGSFELSHIETVFDRDEDHARFKELGGDEYFVGLVEEEYKKVTFVHRLKGSEV